MVPNRMLAVAYLSNETILRLYAFDNDAQMQEEVQQSHSLAALAPKAVELLWEMYSLHKLFGNSL